MNIALVTCLDTGQKFVSDVILFCEEQYLSVKFNGLELDLTWDGASYSTTKSISTFVSDGPAFC